MFEAHLLNITSIQSLGHNQTSTIKGCTFTAADAVTAIPGMLPFSNSMTPPVNRLEVIDKLVLVSDVQVIRCSPDRTAGELYNAMLQARSLLAEPPRWNELYRAAKI